MFYRITWIHCRTLLTIQWQSRNAFESCLRSEATMGGPIVRFGTKWLRNYPMRIAIESSSLHTHPDSWNQCDMMWTWRHAYHDINMDPVSTCCNDASHLCRQLTEVCRQDRGTDDGGRHSCLDHNAWELVWAMDTDQAVLIKPICSNYLRDNSAAIPCLFPIRWLLMGSGSHKGIQSTTQATHFYQTQIAWACINNKYNVM